MNDNQRYLLEEFAEDYRDGRLSRRDFILRAIAIAGGTALAAGFLASAGLTQAEIAAAQEAAPPPAQMQEGGSAVTVSPDDPAIRAEMVEFPSLEPGVGLLQGYLARPATSGTFPGLVIVHENRGLLEHYKDVARRYAKEGFAALAPDLISREGGADSIADANQISGLLGRSDPNRLASDARSAGSFLRQQQGVHESVHGLTGFCFGGGVAWRTSTQDEAIAAAAPYYGPPPPLDAVPNIRASVLGIYAELDQRLTGSLRDLLPALQGAGVRHEIVVYYNTRHAFFNDTGSQYAPEAAADAWARTVKWFRAHLPAPTA